MRSYDGARGIFSFLELVAWATIVLGVPIALIGANGVSQYAGGGAGFIAALPGVAISFIGLLMVAVIQNARATVDTAEYTQQMLKISRDQLEVSKQSLRKGDKLSSGFSSDSTTDSILNNSETAAKSGYSQTSEDVPQRVTDEVIYNGCNIQEIGERFVVDGKSFERIAHAENYIDNILAPQNAMLATKTARASDLSAAAIPQSNPIKSQTKPTSEPMLSKSSELNEEPQDKNNNFVEHNGKTIQMSGDKFMFNSIPFSTLDGAKSYIDKFVSAPAKPLPGVKRP